jgi:hypothetical protein
MQEGTSIAACMGDISVETILEAAKHALKR